MNICLFKNVVENFSKKCVISTVDIEVSTGQVYGDINTLIIHSQTHPHNYA